MLNIVIPISGSSKFFPAEDYIFPQPLIEINGRMMIEHVIDNLKSISMPHRFIFILKNKDIQQFHLDDILNLLTANQAVIIGLEQQTKGAACSVLMAIDYIDSEEALLIVNSDQVIQTDFDKCFHAFNEYDGGTLYFNSAHPRWSYVRLNQEHLIIETAEKRPISNHAIAGLYYFARGQDFIESAKRMIKKDTQINGNFYIAPTFNEMVLMNKQLKAIALEKQNYHSFYSPQKIHEYERELLSQN